ncbi:MAG: hypothetical protein IJG45_05430 [Oscillospiraceae bacterium]|nr:hypothetical protein [Oscillospiraceae bacterium]
MKRFIVYFAALAAVAALFTGCGGMDNVSDNPNGMIESSQATESSSRATMPTETTRRSENGSTSPTEESGADSTAESTEDAPAARGRGPRRF